VAVLFQVTHTTDRVLLSNIAVMVNPIDTWYDVFEALACDVFHLDRKEKAGRGNDLQRRRWDEQVAEEGGEVSVW